MFKRAASVVPAEHGGSIDTPAPVASTLPSDAPGIGSVPRSISYSTRPYGGIREGGNLFGDSVVALDAQTGTYRWHFQATHHDLWDSDPPAPPLFSTSRAAEAASPRSR